MDGYAATMKSKLALDGLDAMGNAVELSWESPGCDLNA